MRRATAIAQAFWRFQPVSRKTVNIQASPFEQDDLRGITRTVAEIHWLLLIVVLLQLVLGDLDSVSSAGSMAGLLVYAAFVMSFRYAAFYKRESRLKISIETAGMIAFITWTLSLTGGLWSPLANAYLLPVITAAFALGKQTTLAEILLVGASQLFLAETFSLSELSVHLAPVVLVAYVVAMFATEARRRSQRGQAKEREHPAPR
jgi:hypothetical protein